MKVSYLHDGSLVVEYPFNMAVTMETSPHPLLSTEHSLQVRRKIILPNDLIHRLEWRYYLRREKEEMQRRKTVRRIGRRMRVGSALHGSDRPRLGDTHMHVPTNPDAVGYEGKVLMVGLQ